MDYQALLDLLNQRRAGRGQGDLPRTPPPSAPPGSDFAEPDPPAVDPIKGSSSLLKASGWDMLGSSLKDVLFQKLGIGQGARRLASKVFDESTPMGNVATGFAESVGNMFDSPVGLATAVAGPGAKMLEGAAPVLSAGLRAIEGAGGVAFGAEGLDTAAHAQTPQEALLGLGQTALGALGARGGYRGLREGLEPPAVQMRAVPGPGGVGTTVQMRRGGGPGGPAPAERLTPGASTDALTKAYTEGPDNLANRIGRLGQGIGPGPIMGEAPRQLTPRPTPPRVRSSAGVADQPDVTSAFADLVGGPEALSGIPEGPGGLPRTPRVRSAGSVQDVPDVPDSGEPLVPSRRSAADILAEVGFGRRGAPPPEPSGLVGPTDTGEPLTPFSAMPARQLPLPAGELSATDGPAATLDALARRGSSEPLPTLPSAQGPSPYALKLRPRPSPPTEPLTTPDVRSPFAALVGDVQEPLPRVHIPPDDLGPVRPHVPGEVLNPRGHDVASLDALDAPRTAVDIARAKGKTYVPGELFSAAQEIAKRMLAKGANPADIMNLPAMERILREGNPRKLWGLERNAMRDVHAAGKPIITRPEAEPAPPPTDPTADPHGEAGFVQVPTAEQLKMAGRALPPALEKLRYFSMLSGPLTQLKNIAGNVGAVASHDAELGINKLIGRGGGEGFGLPKLLSGQTARDVGREFHTPQPGRWGQTSGVLGMPGRLMSAMDAATKDALSRAGIDPEMAREITFTNTPKSQAGKTLTNALRESSAGRLFVPFSQTATNILERGIERTPIVGYIAQAVTDGKLSTSAAKQLLGALAVGGGAALGPGNKTAQAILAPYSLPYTIGATASTALGKGKTPGQAGRTVWDEIRKNLPIPTDAYSADPAQWLASLVPTVLGQVAGTKASDYDTSRSPWLGPSLAKIPGLNDRLLPRKPMKKLSLSLAPPTIR